MPPLLVSFQRGRVAVALFAWLATSMTPAIASPRQEDRLDAYLSSLACRNSIVSGGQNLTGAVNFWTTSNRHPFSVFTIVSDRSGVEKSSRIKTFSPINGHYLSKLNDGTHSGATRLYWSRDDDFVVWDYKRLWWLDGNSVGLGGRAAFKSTDVPRTIYPIMRGGDESVPEHFTNVVLSAGGNYRDIVTFDPRSGLFADLGIAVGINGGVAWTQGQTFVRVTPSGQSRQKHLEMLGPDLETWQLFSPFKLPADVSLLLLRDNAVASELEIVAAWRDQDGIGQIGVIRRGAPTPRIIAAGPIERVVAAPDRSGLYGYIDQIGRFHRIPSEVHLPDIVFWLSKIEAMEGVEDFHLLGNARYAVVKANEGSAGPNVTVMERRGNTASSIGSLCETRAQISRITKSDKAILFLPAKPAGNTLVVYLHGGPRYNVNESGDIYVDLLTGQGHAVLAVNYTGSINEKYNRQPAQELTETFAREVEHAVKHVQGLPGMGSRKIAILANSFGSIVGVSALLSGRVTAERLLVVAGVVDSKLLLSINGPALDSAYLNYLGRVAREVRPFDITKLIRLHPRLQLGFLHGGRDGVAPVSDIEDFVKRFNASNPPVPARLMMIREMGHTPSTRADHQEHNEAIATFFSE